MKHFKKTVEDMYPVLEPHLHPMDRGAFGDEFLRTKNSYEWLASIAWELQPMKILEIGVRFGYGAISMLWGVAKGEPPAETVYIGIDDESAEPGSNAYARQAISKFGKNVGVSHERFTGILLADLTYVDGNHTVDGMLVDMEFARIETLNSGIILVDDVTFIPSLMEPAQKWAKEHGFETECLPTHRGLLVLSAR